MTEPERYPPPDFSGPPPPFPPPARTSGFHPGMWSWTDPSSWDHRPAWSHWAAAGPGFPSERGHYGHGRGFAPTSVRGAGRARGRQSCGAKQQGRKKKEPDFSHYCDTCDQGFRNQEKFDVHVSQHVKCSVQDCSFTAHEKLVSVHWKHNHAPGAKRIKLDTPEEIARWREDRRRNYPTLGNIERKKKMLEVREEAGGVLDTAQFGRMRGRGRNNRGFQRCQGPDPTRPDPGSRPADTSTSLQSRSGDPLGALASSDHDSDKEDPAGGSRTAGLVVAPRQMSSALGSLMSSYGSMSDTEDDDNPEATPTRRAQELVQENQTALSRIPVRSQDAGSVRAVETSTEVLETHGVGRPDSGLNRWSRRGRRHGRHGDTAPTRRPTLLEMLLAPDIRHERNVLLQCVRHVVRNHFFGLEDGPQARDHMGDESKPDGGTAEDEQTESGASRSASPSGGDGCPAGSSTEDKKMELSERHEAVVVGQGSPTNAAGPAAGPESTGTIEGTGEDHDPPREKLPSDMYGDERWECGGGTGNPTTPPADM